MRRGMKMISRGGGWREERVTERGREKKEREKYKKNEQK